MFLLWQTTVFNNCPCHQDNYDYFTPDRWVYRDSHLILEGNCYLCKRPLSSSVPAPDNHTLYRCLRLYRPYYKRCEKWYKDQDDLTLEQRNALFISLFPHDQQEAARQWVYTHHGAEPYTKPHRDRKSTLFKAIIDSAGLDLDSINQILDYTLANDRNDSFLTDYRFDISPRISFGGSEGIYVDLCLEGSYDDSDSTLSHLGTFKTLRTDLDACRLMGELCGILMYYGTKYVNSNIHRYTPEKELEKELLRKLREP